ncbi:helix-turn-helix transcriptional regulator [Siccirubricoccus sp. G192]|uniref:helix-turn-helix transcriptional regulator n=1 Tax=Siccirubricoccus sp. G192 TaxID=2849651 RepID=UPI0035C795F7
MAAGCSTRTLSEAFQKFRGKTPLQGLHEIRLEQARRALATGGDAASLAQVARHCGFTNSGRFKAAYQQLFGQTPSETLSHKSP